MAAPTLPALSIRQPWAWAITHLGKDIENRTWRSPYRGPFLIHAGKGLKLSDIGDFMACVAMSKELTARLEAAGGLNTEALKAMTGGIVGTAEITGRIMKAHPQALSPWFFGPYGYTLANARPLPFEPCNGQLGFFTPAIGADAPAPKLSQPPAQAELPL